MSEPSEVVMPEKLEPTQLSAAQQRALGHRVRSDMDTLIVDVPHRLTRRVARAIELLGDTADNEAALEDFLAKLEGPVPRPAVAAATARTELQWRRVQSRYGLLTSAEVADAAGSTATNRSEYASHLARTGKIVSIRRAGRALYPGFQFRYGKPVPGVAEVLHVLREADWTDESIVLWLASPNGYLGEVPPAEVLEWRREEVLDAARDAAAAW